MEGNTGSHRESLLFVFSQMINAAQAFFVCGSSFKQVRTEKRLFLLSAYVSDVQMPGGKHRDVWRGSGEMGEWQNLSSRIVSAPPLLCQGNDSKGKLLGGSPTASGASPHHPPCYRWGRDSTREGSTYAPTSDQQAACAIWQGTCAGGQSWASGSTTKQLCNIRPVT